MQSLPRNAAGKYGARRGEAGLHASNRASACVRSGEYFHCRVTARRYRLRYRSARRRRGRYTGRALSTRLSLHTRIKITIIKTAKCQVFSILISPLLFHTTVATQQMCQIWFNDFPRSIFLPVGSPWRIKPYVTCQSSFPFSGITVAGVKVKWPVGISHMQIYPKHWYHEPYQSSVQPPPPWNGCGWAYQRMEPRWKRIDKSRKKYEEKID